MAERVDLPHDTDGLIAYHREHAEGVDPDLLERAIPEAIDALYEARDADKTMHQAGAEIAVTVLRTVLGPRSFTLRAGYEGAAHKWFVMGSSARPSPPEDVKVVEVVILR